MQYVAIIAALCLLSVGMSGCISQSGYEFKTGTTPPTEVSNLLKNGTVVLFLTKNNCPICEQVKPKIADLQTQYNGTNVIFAHFNFEDNATSQRLFSSYGVQNTPTTIVVRKDGASATFISDFDASTLKSAIGDAQKWK
jgi:thiol-disulfide isomerase/thioredoxin